YRRALDPLLHHVARFSVALARIVVTLAGALDRLLLQIAPAAGAPGRPDQRRGDADAQDDRGDRARIFARSPVNLVTRGVVRFYSLVRHVVESLSHGHASFWGMPVIEQSACRCHSSVGCLRPRSAPTMPVNVRRLRWMTGAGRAASGLCCCT